MSTEEKLGFSKIKEFVANECTNALAVRMVDEMSFSSNFERVERNLLETDEMKQILLMEQGFPVQDFFDLTEELQRLKVGNTVIDIAALFDLKCSLHTISDIVRFIMRDGGTKYPRLCDMAQKVDVNPAITRALNKIVGEKGEILDDASPLLLEIRRQIQRKQVDVDAQINRSLARAKREGWAPENAEATIRNGRLVIPMLDTHRRKMKGLIHDESATRQTAYLEPVEVVELNNDLRELEFAERHEIQRILGRFSDMLRPEIPQLTNAYWFLARIDFVRAKARFAIAIHGVKPILTDTTHINWLDARHPLLVLNAESKHDREVVPFSMNLDAQKRILIVSGPNAGGKSVCLKAVGLIQYMLQAGLLVPCRETSEFGLFSSIFIDIGDQQSIENDLSTYTSHLLNMKTLLSQADASTLFLIDELGGGTEPRSGCAIAEALLEELYKRQSFGVVTTHFADLKLLADRYDGIINGAMLFDTALMKPLYRLSIGHPGSSFAFEIASNVGFPANVLEEAGKKVGHEMLNFEHQLQQIELDRQEVARQRAELEMSDSFLNEVIVKYQRLTAKLEERKYEILSQARQEAKQILSDANRTVERTISDIRESQAEKTRTQQARENLKQTVQQIEQQQTQHDEQIQTLHVSSKSKQSQSQAASAPEKPEIVEGPIVVGDIVRIEGQDSYGQVVEIKGRKAVIESNSLRMTIGIDRLQKTKKKAIPTDRTRRENRFQSIYDDINEKRKLFNPTLDLRGHRAEEALSELEQFLDQALLLSEKELRILHGHGYGILKTLVRDRLRAMPEVKNIHSEQIELGGDGVTVVHLR